MQPPAPPGYPPQMPPMQQNIGNSMQAAGRGGQAALNAITPEVLMKLLAMMRGGGQAQAAQQPGGPPPQWQHPRYSTSAPMQAAQSMFTEMRNAALQGAPNIGMRPELMRPPPPPPAGQSMQAPQQPPFTPFAPIPR